MTPIETCQSLEDVRRNIDRIDKALVQLIAERGQYVTQAARFKKTTADVAAPQRVAEVIAKVTTLAKAEGAHPAVVAATWQAMITAFIEAEKQVHARLPPHP